MSRLPAGRPSSGHDATLRDSWALLKVGVSMLVLALWNFPLWRWLMIGALSLLFLEVVVIALLGGEDVAVMLLAFIVGLPIMCVVIVAIHTVWRVLDPNRLVWLAPDGGSLVDVIFKSRNRISLANHGRAFKATSAPALRDSVAEWVAGLEGYELDIRAQNRKVAELYVEQFPQLEIIGTDWMGHPRLGLTRVASRQRSRSGHGQQSD